MRDGEEMDGTAESVELAEFYCQERAALIVFVRHHGASLQEADDAVQTAFSKVLPPKWASIRHPKAYLRKIAVRAYIESSSAAEHGEQGEGPPDSGATPGDAVEARESAMWLQHVLAALPPKQREVMAMHLDDYSHAEIAEELGIKVSAVRQNFRRARQTLKASYIRQRRDTA